MKKIFLNKKGMTLVEIVVAISLFAVMTVPISMMFINSLKFNRMAYNKLVSNNVMRVVKANVKTGFENGEILDTKTLADGTKVDIKVPTTVGDTSYECHVWDALSGSYNSFPGYTYKVKFLSRNLESNIYTYEINLFRNKKSDYKLLVELYKK